MKSFSILSLTPEWDRLKNVDLPSISAPEFQGLPSSGTSNGISSASLASRSTPLPFACPARTNGSTASTIAGGTVNGISVTSLTPTISATGTKYVYLDVELTLAINSFSCVTGISSISGITIDTGSSIPSNTPTHFYRQVAVYSSGVRISQDITSSMEVVARDDGSNTSVAVAIWGQS